MNEGLVYHERVRAADAGAELLAYHARRFRHSTLEEWRRTIAAGRVQVNGRVAASGQLLRAGDRLEFHRPPWIEPAAPLHFEVVYEDEDLLALDKPAGLQVLPAGPFHAHTLLALVQKSSAARAECAPVHRLGRGTSGLVLFGKNAAARASLSAQFRGHAARKTYLALASGTTLPHSWIARHSIGLRAHGPLQLACADPLGKPAVTRLRVLARDAARGRSLVAAQPITGRPNQIRIHLAASGAALVGDPLFGPGGLPIRDVSPADGGYFLHAAALGVRHPATGCWLKLRSRPPWLA
jgi:23S rRNA pseudouridine1911/1915/1917 synthase